MVVRALTVAGSDPTGGAGIQADLKAFTAREVDASAVPTAITVQSASGVRHVHALDPDLITRQLEAVMESVPPAAVKAGMLHDAGIVRALHRVLERHADLPFILDPVITSSSGHRLLDDHGVWALVETLLPRTDLLTPNADEASVLSRMPVRNEQEAREAAVTLQALGARAVLVKGGHLQEGTSPDVLFDGAAFHVFEAPRLDLGRTHGTGCLLSAVITAEVAKGLPMFAAVATAKMVLARALERGTRSADGVLLPDISALRDEPEQA